MSLRIGSLLIVALSFLNFGLAVDDEPYIKSTDSIGPPTSIGSKVLEAVTTGGGVCYTLTPGSSGNTLNRVEDGVTEVLDANTPTFALSGPHVVGIDEYVPFIVERKAFVGAYGMGGFVQRPVDMAERFADMDSTFDPMTGTGYLSLYDAVGFTIVLKRTQNWTSFQDIAIDGAIAGLVARSTVFGSSRQRVLFLNGYVFIIFEAQENTAVNRLYMLRYDTTTEATTLFPLFTVTNNSPNLANGTESSIFPVKDCIGFVHVDRGTANLVTVHQTTGDFIKTSLGSVSDGLEGSASSGSSLEFGRVAVLIDGRAFGFQLVGEPPTGRMMRLGEFSTCFDSGPVAFALGDYNMGHGVGNQNGLGVKAHLNFGNIKAFAQILDKLTVFFICNLENAEQKICYNINDEMGEAFRVGELTLGPRESAEVSLTDAQEIKAGWGIFQGTGAYAIKAQFELGLDFGNPPPPPVGVQATQLFQKWITGWNEGTVTPGIAIVNGGSWDTDCTGLVYDADGNLVDEKFFVLKTRQRISSFNSGFFTGVSVEGGFQGWLCIACDQRVGMMSLDAVTARQQELIGTPANGQDFLLTVDSKIQPGHFNFLVGPELIQ